jgi:two-component system, cell cycle sensor histidine kinase and response regulator CckA
MRFALGKKTIENLGLDYKALFGSLPGMYLVLKQDFKILAVNDQYLKITLEKYEKLVGSNFFETFQKNLNNPEDEGMRQVKISLEKVMKDKSPDYMSIQKFKIRKKTSGNEKYEERYWRILNTPICNKKNEIDYIILKIDDVTENMKLKLENIQNNKDFLRLRYKDVQKEKIQRSQRIESIGQLTGGVSHDINNMLTIINLNCDIILNSSQSISSVVKKQCEQIKKTCKHAARLIQQILRFTKKQTVNAKVLNINFSIIDIEKMLLRLLSENISLELNLDNGIDNILADPAQIEQIILNLVINSRDAILDIGKIRIETSNIYIERDSEFGSHKISAGKYILLSVQDNGIGMDPETQAMIFEPFFSTKEEGKGTGLGLATVFTIVGHYKGTIDVKSERGKGTAFHIYLPITVLKEDTVNADKQQQASLQGNESILIVEDKEELRDLLSVALKSYGYQVTTASNGLEAIELVQKKQNKFHLVIADVIMPKMGGKIMSDKMIEIFPKLKIIFLSGYTEEILILNGIETDSPFLLEKPFTILALLSKVKNVLMY